MKIHTPLVILASLTLAELASLHRLFCPVAMSALLQGLTRPMARRRHWFFKRPLMGGHTPLPLIRAPSLLWHYANDAQQTGSLLGRKGLFLFLFTAVQIKFFKNE
jgi:hypothetical protein